MSATSRSITLTLPVDLDAALRAAPSFPGHSALFQAAGRAWLAGAGLPVPAGITVPGWRASLAARLARAREPIDPVTAAFDAAPTDTRPETPEERRAVRAAKVAHGKKKRRTT